MATKADIGDLRTDFVAFQAEVKAELKTMRWFISLGVPASIAVTGIIVQLINQG